MAGRVPVYKWDSNPKPDRINYQFYIPPPPDNIPNDVEKNFAVVKEALYLGI